VVLLAIGLRTWGALREPILFDDAPRFLGAARLILEGQYRAALTDAYHPLTAALMACISALGGVDLESAGLILSILSGGFATAALYTIARDMFDERVALISALLFAVFPRTVAASANVKSDGLHLALFLGGALLAWRALERGRFRHALGAGILCGLAYLARPEGLAVGVVLGVWLLLDLATLRISWPRFFTVVGGFAAAVLLFGGPYVLSLSEPGQGLTISQKKSLVPSGWSGLSLPQLGAALSEVLRDFQRGWEALWLFVIPALRWKRPSRQTLYLCSYTVLFFFLLLAVHLEAGYVSRRHWLAPAALLMPFAALGMLRIAAFLGHWISKPRLRQWVTPLYVAAVIGGFVAHEMMRPPDEMKLARKQAALWLRQYEVRTLAAQRKRAAYYAGAERLVPFVNAPDPIVLRDELRAAGAEFLVAEAGALPPLPPGGVPGLSEVHRVGYPGGHVLVLRVEEVPDVAAPGP
jgi:4-amino-4-deoxy-L-arabinose transferase-like glycosyltransferase